MPQGWGRGTRTEETPRQLNTLTFRRDKKLRKVTNRDPAMEQMVRKAFDPHKSHDRTISNESGSNLLSSISVSNLLSLFH
jgi:hypothetical protein